VHTLSKKHSVKNKPLPEDFLVEATAEAWQHRHLKEFGEDSVGLGGLMTADHAKNLLKSAGKAVLEYHVEGQVNLRPPSQAQQAQPLSYYPFAGMQYQHTPSYYSQHSQHTPFQYSHPHQQSIQSTSSDKRKRETKEKTVKIVKGQSLEGLPIPALGKALFQLQKPAGKNTKMNRVMRLQEALNEKPDGFEMTVTYMS